MQILLARLARHAAERPDVAAYRKASGGEITWRGLADGVAAVAGEVRRNLPAGAVVILWCGNQLEYPVACLGILSAGATVFPISTEAADAEALRAAKESGAVGIIGDERAMRLLAGSMRWAMPAHALFPSSGTPGEGQGGGSSRRFPDRRPPPQPSPGVPEEGEAGSLLLQSSGTMGTPKIVRRTGRSLDAIAAAMAESVGFTPEDRVLMTVPLTHSYGIEHGLLAPVWAGSTVHLCPLTPIAGVFSELSRNGITIFPGVPSTWEMLLAATGSETAMPDLRIAYSAGAPLPRSVFDAFKQRFGLRITQLYGTTETGSVAYNSPADPFAPVSVGRPMRDVSIRVIDAGADRREGHVVIRAASMFDGYLHGSTDLIDGHFPTGDLGYLDDSGRLFITGRLKLLIDVGGLKVNPLEVESVLRLHPSVESCVVVPVRQSETVFRLKAIVTPRPPAKTVPIAELRQLAREHLSTYKIPRLFEVRNSLPKSATGKILRHLVEMS